MQTHQQYNKGFIIKKSKELSFLLRHDRKYTFDEHGYRTISDLVENHHYSVELIEEIVRSDDKQRYEYSDDKTKIRATQGHSIDVDVELKEEIPPDVLYHGTATRFLESIYKNGINSGNRNYVHLSLDSQTATNVGKRHGKPFVLEIDAKRMHEDGIKFFLSNNGVWLTKFVDSKYIKNQS